MTPLPLLNMIFDILNDKNFLLGGRHYSDTINITQYEKVNPRTKKLVKIIKGTCSICSRNKSQIFTKLNDTRRRLF